MYDLSNGNEIGAKRESLLRKWYHSYNCMLYEYQHDGVRAKGMYAQFAWNISNDHSYSYFF